MNDRPPLHTLNSKLRVISRAVPEGSFWRHQKSGTVYEVVTLAISESTGDCKVVYRPASAPSDLVLTTALGREYDVGTGREVYSHLVFERPLSEWEELVDIDGDLIEHQPRFKRVERATIYV